MDSSLSDDIAISQSDIARLSQSDQLQLQQFIQSENQKATVQRTIHEFTETCFKKCIKQNSFTSGKLSGKEEGCMVNCVGRFLDCNLEVLRKLQGMGQG
ncbi:hypothetical protein BT93_L1013 [Corymbia citriodora subsp. variegata]|uniref:Mitochondrial import inner membrane translocase subunit n=1 Tax=Corymbia citriodora subsp. variegata TaxID=360336 RepID=A0A8T0CEJ4_CORYI|nr:hypothetical protein BT93_L1013 [Corymbia citriodora subsp. variegata]